MFLSLFSQKGGITVGTCAGGFGVCCVFSLFCGGTTTTNLTTVSTGIISGASTKRLKLT